MAKKHASSSQMPPKIYKATRGSLGRVIRGREISIDEAVLERLAGRDIVVCGPDRIANSRVAKAIEGKVGIYIAGVPHTKLGPYVLPHFQPLRRPPEGHSFYETENRKAAINP